MTTPDDIQKLSETVSKATSGTWSWEDGPPTLYAGRVDPVGEIGGWPVRGHGYNLLGRLDPDGNTPNNLDAIVEAVNWVRFKLPQYVAKQDELEAENARLRECLGFFASCIKSGEPWSDICQERYLAAQNQTI